MCLYSERVGIIPVIHPPSLQRLRKTVILYDDVTQPARLIGNLGSLAFVEHVKTCGDVLKAELTSELDVFLLGQRLREAVGRHLGSRGLLHIHFSSLNCLAQPELVYVNVLKLSLKLFSCLSNNPNRLLVIAVYNQSNTSLKVKLAKEVVLLYNL